MHLAHCLPRCVSDSHSHPLMRCRVCHQPPRNLHFWLFALAFCLRRCWIKSLCFVRRALWRDGLSWEIRWRTRFAPAACSGSFATVFLPTGRSLEAKRGGALMLIWIFCQINNMHDSIFLVGASNSSCFYADKQFLVFFVWSVWMEQKLC
jgi:hypothetical protein